MIDQKVGPYRVRELINEGGTAALYVAAGPGGETVALRILLRRHRFNWTQRSMFTRGRKIHSGFDSEYIIKFHHAGSYQLRPYSVMEFIPGRNLRFVLHKNQEELAGRKWEIILNAARAMQKVHDAGYVHLDIKPENYVVTPYWKVKLTDFDLCARLKVGARITKKKIQGTPAYMPPEIHDKQPFDFRADVFSFGVMCYELLSGGRKPVENLLSNDPGYEMQIRPLSEFVPDISRGVDRVILKCLASDMNDRYPAAWMLISALEKELRGSSGASPRPPAA